ncbi:hypothetical protein CLUG_05653 [Clavispora lusitaniae ATCC 42720]|uniref:DUF202 domain-containing protein n=3 Tax=Clavispora lusitaniae TaxID=36911 RepID=C4YBS5_CLAL4|nr:uncharacterized protein CLUG_05653 [Clavispora lusitaniae ATCC 42720]EEQ41525.1 hypothetical protein CLUG_05653 [Clavispora lusitaniae ATCC 42720]
MANERTFLAWLRTSLSLVTIGIGVAQLLKIQKPDSLGRLQASWAKPLGASIICIGILTLFMGFSRYFRVQQMLLQTRYPVSRYSVSILITAVSALIISVLLVLYV